MNPKPNGYNIFRAGVYGTQGNWANASDFCEYFKTDFSSIEFDTGAVLKKIDELTEKKMPSKIGQKEALEILANQELANVRTSIKNLNFNENTEDELFGNLEKLRQLFSGMGIIYKRPLFIVDHFPKPYDFFNKTGTNGTNFDDSDHKMFGLVQGLYLKRQRLNHITSTFILAHELIHNVIGAKDSNYLARGLEEGFTQFFGEIYLGAQIFGYGYAGNYMINARLRYPAEIQRWELYVDWLRQGCVFYQKFGIDGMVMAMKNGRGFIKKADKLMLDGRQEDLDLCKGGWNPELDSIAQIVLSFNRKMVYSPLAVYLAKKLKKGESVTELLTRLNVKKSEGMAALKELNERIFSILATGGKIVIDDTKIYLNSHNLRYEIPKKN